MARLFVSFVHEDEKVASAVQGLLQTELDLREEVFLSSDKSQIYAGDRWLEKIKEALLAAEIVILMLSRRSVARPWVNFEAGAAWLADKKVIPVCYGNLSKDALPHPYSAIQAQNFVVRIVLLDRKRQPSNEPRPDFACGSVQGRLGPTGPSDEGRRIRAFGERACGIQRRLTSLVHCPDKFR